MDESEMLGRRRKRMLTVLPVASGSTSSTNIPSLKRSMIQFTPLLAWKTPVIHSGGILLLDPFPFKADENLARNVDSQTDLEIHL